MREIKFRAWVPKEKVMVGWEELIADQYEFNEFNIEGGLVFLQYTGLKDKNGVEIYEGDIVKVTSISFGNRIGKVVSSKGCFFYDFGEQKDSYTSELCFIPLKSEVIGNIYENPELLEIR